MRCSGISAARALLAMALERCLCKAWLAHSTLFCCIVHNCLYICLGIPCFRDYKCVDDVTVSWCRGPAHLASMIANPMALASEDKDAPDF